MPRRTRPHLLRPPHQRRQVICHTRVVVRVVVVRVVGVRMRVRVVPLLCVRVGVSPPMCTLLLLHVRHPSCVLLWVVGAFGRACSRGGLSDPTSAISC